MLAKTGKKEGELVGLIHRRGQGRSNAQHAFVRVGKPLARTDDLVIEEVEDEVLIYDATSNRAHCLGATAARVWRACDGNSDVSALSDALDLSVDVVNQALDELEALELLDNQGLKVVHSTEGNGHATGNGITRRQFGTKVGEGRRRARRGPAGPLGQRGPGRGGADAEPFHCNTFSSGDCGTSSGCGALSGCCCCCHGVGSARPAPQPISAATPPHPAVSVRRPRDQHRTART